jgi:acetyl-CoA carboxylase biotin carboxyl carrier protein
MISRPDDLQSQAASVPAGDDELASLPSLVAEIVETMRKGNLERLEVSRGDFYLSLQSFSRESVTRPEVAARSGAGTSDLAAETSDVDDVRTHTITSPMIGTFYVAPAPGEAPFVQPGDTIEQDQVIGIVEAMKIMNEIASDRHGTVIEVLADDGETVEYGSPLVRLALDA